MKMTDFRALCKELVELLEVSEEWSGCTQPQALTRARAALAKQPVEPTLMERALAGDATAAKQFLHEAGFTDKHGQWLPQYQPIPDELKALPNE
jgi:hypothetical protein